jgi:hypothetical protein
MKEHIMNINVRQILSGSPLHSPLLCSSLGRLAEAAVFASRGGAINLADMRSRTRCVAPVARARQAAMYLAHIGLGLNLTSTGLAFGRDRTTVRHACHLVEDARGNCKGNSRGETAADLALAALEAGIAMQARSLDLLQ